MWHLFAYFKSHLIEFIRLDLCNANRTKEHDGYLAFELEPQAKSHKIIKLTRRKFKVSVLWTKSYQGRAQ